MFSHHIGVNPLLNSTVINKECPICGAPNVDIDSKVWKKSDLFVVPEGFIYYVNNEDTCKQKKCPIEYSEI